MAQWILNRPAEAANLGELRVAELLAPLPDDWVIRWGFFYEDNAGTTREGDFLILGPNGGLLVLETKSGSLDVFPATGRWDTDDHDNPLFQLDAEWASVVKTVNAHRGQNPTLFVQKALALPQLDLAADLEQYHGIPRKVIFSGRELRCFTNSWHSLFDSAPMDGRSRQIFFDAYAKDLQPKAIRHFTDEADRALFRQTEINYELLDALGENRQLMVKGGTGSGKTFLAFEQACRWADQCGSGSRVLFLCYNLALTDFVREMTARAKARGKPARGEIVVLSWEELAESLLARSGLPYEVPGDSKAKIGFYTHTLPQLMAQVALENGCSPEYDALIVDEAQDHDTGVESFPDGWEGPGWWGIYWRLLREGRQARIAVFYDPAQRPVFRSETEFEDASLYRALGANPVRVHLSKSVRYSRPILKFLKTLHTPALAALVDSLRQGGTLPDGPDVEISDVKPAEVPKTVASIIERWVGTGLCRPEEILLLSLHGRPERSALGDCGSLGGCLVRDFLKRQVGCVSRTSVNKAKGLDSRGVIMVDFPPFKQLQEPGLQVGYFMGASRARQLLAIVQQV